jgi:hypothetical protein
LGLKEQVQKVQGLIHSYKAELYEVSSCVRNLESAIGYAGSKLDELVYGLPQLRDDAVVELLKSIFKAVTDAEKELACIRSKSTYLKALKTVVEKLIEASAHEVP